MYRWTGTPASRTAGTSELTDSKPYEGNRERLSRDGRARVTGAFDVGAGPTARARVDLTDGAEANE
ncbi:hypothetical protein EA473_02100 [Natrarchaeobius chitinivorans]|uniref:Uncharacterized protein n=1 Tax=Natrarchaeobius chitinivorans TaxID=1679083 RepID=A0A3N6PIC6_NATCH|nr:hypothetical protein EA473_02100 [Natrarchaeobius chitinivorans]